MNFDLREALSQTTMINEQTRVSLCRVIVHIHGGGYIAMSPESHSSYLRKFVLDAHAVAFSIDYPLAPHQRYITIVECVFKAYLQILVT